MRGLLGALVLVGGVAGLSYWGATSHAVRMQDAVSNGARAAVSDAVHRITTTVSGRDIRASGLADSQTEKDAVLAVLNGVNGRRVVVDEIEVLARVAPYTTELTKGENGLVATGHVPHDDMRAALDELGASGGAKMTLASGAPEGWQDALTAGKAGLDQLEAGRFGISGAEAVLSGTARTPIERDAALAAVETLTGFAVQSDIEMLDDGTPPNYEISFNTAGTVSVNGKLPMGLTKEELVAPLGLTDVRGAPSASLIDKADGGAEVQKILAGLRPWFAELSSAIISARGGTTEARIAFVEGVDGERLGAVMAQSVPADALTVVNPAAAAQEGATRFNALTDTDEEFVSGFWLPVVDFEPRVATCQARSDELLSTVRVSFETGSANLSAEAATALNKISGVVRKCALGGGLNATIGGHTDSVGGENANLSLSKARAAAVVEALAARGVPKGKFLAIGYGATEPVADNDTEVGRAKNRRTTIEWIKR